MVELSGKQRSYLRALAHHRPVSVQVGAGGVSDAVMSEIDAALARHELLKIRLHEPSRVERTQMIAAICRRAGAVAVQHIGKVAVIYRAGDDPQIHLPGGQPSDDA